MIYKTLYIKLKIEQHTGFALEELDAPAPNEAPIRSKLVFSTSLHAKLGELNILKSNGIFTLLPFIITKTIFFSPYYGYKIITPLFARICVGVCILLTPGTKMTASFHQDRRYGSITPPLFKLKWLYQDLWFSNPIVSINTQKRQSWEEIQALGYSINWDI